MPGAGCDDYRCCVDETEGIPACWYWAALVGFAYNPTMDPAYHPECYSGITRDGTQSDQTGCRHCDIGCHGFEDDLSHLLAGALWVDGKSYLRSELDGRFGRDAHNRRFDLVTNTPTLIGRRCRLEHASCYENNPSGFGGWVCWGHHVCQCTPEPDWSDPCEVPTGYPVYGLTPGLFFFNFQGWPPPSQGIAEYVNMFCRHFGQHGSPRNAAISVHRHGRSPVYNAVFLRSREGMNVDTLVPCAGRIAATDCDNPTYGDCTYGGERAVGSYINTETSSQGKLDELWIDLDTVDIRMRDHPSLSDQQRHEHQLYADIFAEAIGRTYPDPEAPTGTVRMDRVAMRLSQNDYIGLYERTWNGEGVCEESELPIIIRFPWCYTRWGKVYLSASMVITYCKILVNLTVPHFAQSPPHGSGDAATHWIEPYATVELQVHTAMKCFLVPNAVMVGGQPVALTMPTWVQGTGYDGIPTVSPQGNQILYARERDEQGRPLVVRPFRKWRWYGRLGSFSDPVTQPNPEYPDFDYANMNCEDLIDVIGTFRVPALATANESHPEDPNRNWTGGISFHFSHQA